MSTTPTLHKTPETLIKGNIYKVIIDELDPDPGSDYYVISDILDNNHISMATRVYSPFCYDDKEDIFQLLDMIITRDYRNSPNVLSYNIKMLVLKSSIEGEGPLPRKTGDIIWLRVLDDYDSPNGRKMCFEEV